MWYTNAMNILSWPFRKALDLVFGKAEPFDYVSPTVRQAMDMEVED